MKGILKLRFLPVALILCFSAHVFAQEKTIAPEKKKIIAEIITTLKADQKVKEVMQAVMKQISAGYPMLIQGMLEKETGLTPAQKSAIAAELIEKNDNYTARFEQKMVRAINFQDFIEATIYPLYDKYFTEDELKDLLAFYKTPTGQKLNDTMPQFAAESIRLSQEYLMPKLNGIFEEIMKEQTQKQPPPPKGRPNK